MTDYLVSSHHRNIVQLTFPTTSRQLLVGKVSCRCFNATPILRNESSEEVESIDSPEVSKIKQERIKMAGEIEINRSYADNKGGIDQTSLIYRAQSLLPRDENGMVPSLNVQKSQEILKAWVIKEEANQVLRDKIISTLESGKPHPDISQAANLAYLPFLSSYLKQYPKRWWNSISNLNSWIIMLICMFISSPVYSKLYNSDINSYLKLLIALFLMLILRGVFIVVSDGVNYLRDKNK